MRYMPTLRSPVSGSRVTTHGSVMKRPPSSGQHLRMGRLRIVGSTRASRVVVGASPTTLPVSEVFPTRASETAPGAGALPKIFGALRHGVLRLAGASNFWITSLHEPLFTIFGFA